MGNRVQKATEERMLRAFRRMHPEDIEIITEFAEARATAEDRRKFKLRLVSSNFCPTNVAAFGSSSS